MRATRPQGDEDIYNQGGGCIEKTYHIIAGYSLVYDRRLLQHEPKKYKRTTGKYGDHKPASRIITGGVITA